MFFRIHPTFQKENYMQKKYRRLMYIVVLFAIIFGMHSFADATETEPPTEHTHEWRVQVSRKDYHQYICNVCYETRQEAHTFDSEGNCTVCGHHEHEWHCVWSDDQMHNIICNGCGEERTSTHTKNSEGVCTVCGHTPHEHIWQYNGEHYGYSHGLKCTQCAAISSEDHIYGNDGKCTVCGQEPPHECQWEWDGNKSNHREIHFMVCACGATTSARHDMKWNGTYTHISHTLVCNVCGFTISYTHGYNPAIYNGERCTVCGYQGQGATGPEPNPNETTPAETKPADNKPAETKPADNKPAETKPADTLPTETQPTETTTGETTPAETVPQDTDPTVAAPENTTAPTVPETSDSASEMPVTDDSPSSGKAWIWVVSIVVILAGLSTAFILMKKKLS